MLTVEDVQKALNEIYNSRNDPEEAHGLEDQLYCKVLEAIANDTAIDPRGCAALALRSQGMDFARWCA